MIHFYIVSAKILCSLTAGRQESQRTRIWARQRIAKKRQLICTFYAHKYYSSACQLIASYCVMGWVCCNTMSTLKIVSGYDKKLWPKIQQFAQSCDFLSMQLGPKCEKCFVLENKELPPPPDVSRKFVQCQHFETRINVLFIRRRCCASP